MAAKWRNTQEYHKWRAKTIARDGVCVVCSSPIDLQAHHVEDGSNNPKLRFKLANSVTMCMHCHTSFHTDYKKSFRQKTTKNDLDNFIRIVNYVNSESFGKK